MVCHQKPWRKINGVNQALLLQWVRRAGLRLQKRYTPEFKQRMFDAVRGGASAKEVSKMHGVNHAMFLQWCRDAGVPWKGMRGPLRR